MTRRGPSTDRTPEAEAHAAANHRWYVANAERIKAHAKEYDAAHTAEKRISSSRWRKANAERVRENKRRYRDANLDRVREQERSYRAAHPEQYRDYARASLKRQLEADADAFRRAANERNRRWKKLHPKERVAEVNRRRAFKKGVLLTVHVESEVCGVCEEPLTDRQWPDPLATTVGHEPPLAVVAREGWLIVTERPEHFVCNMWKKDRLDMEMEATA